MGPSAREAIPELIETLKIEDNVTPPVSFYAACALAGIGKPAIPALVKRLKEPEEAFACFYAAKALADMGSEAREAIPELIAALSGQNGEHAAKALGGIGKPAVPALVETLKSSKGVEGRRLRFYAALALSNIGTDAKDAAPALTEILKNTDSGLKLSVAFALCRVNRRDVTGIAALQAGLVEAHPPYRSLAATYLSQLGPDAASAVPALARAAADPDEQVRKACVLALGRIGRDGQTTVPALIRALKDEQPDIRGSAGTALGWCALRPESAVTALAKALCDREATVRRGAAFALSEYGSEARAAAPALAEAFQDTEEDVRRQAAETLRDIATSTPAEAIPLLTKALKNPDARHRSLAVFALSFTGPAATEALTSALQDGDQQVREDVASGLASLGERGQAAVPVLLEIAKGTANSDPDTNMSRRLHSLKALGKIGPPAAAGVPIAREALRDKDSEMREWAADCLAGIGPSAKSSLPNLRVALKDPNVFVRFAAARALLQIGGAADEAKVTLDEAEATLQANLTSANWDDRISAAGHLIQIPGESAVVLPVLREALASKDSTLRLEALCALTTNNTLTRDVLSILRQALRDEALAEDATLFVGRYGPAAREATPELLVILDRPFSPIVSRVRKALREINPAEAAKVAAR
jgi:HEAT repeat protein